MKHERTHCVGNTSAALTETDVYGFSIYSGNKEDVYLCGKKCDCEKKKHIIEGKTNTGDMCVWDS